MTNGGLPLIPVTTIVVPQIQEQGVGVTRQEFELLLEGAPTSRHVSRRDVCLGMAATALVGVVGVFLTAEYFQSGKPKIWAFVFTVLLVAAFLAASVVAWLAHCDSKRLGPSAYAYCVDRIRQRFGPAPAQQPGPGS